MQEGGDAALQEPDPVAADADLRGRFRHVDYGTGDGRAFPWRKRAWCKAGAAALFDMTLLGVDCTARTSTTPARWNVAIRVGTNASGRHPVWSGPLLPNWGSLVRASVPNSTLKNGYRVQRRLKDTVYAGRWRDAGLCSRARGRPVIPSADVFPHLSDARQSDQSSRRCAAREPTTVAHPAERGQPAIANSIGFIVRASRRQGESDYWRTTWTGALSPARCRQRACACTTRRRLADTSSKRARKSSTWRAADRRGSSGSSTARAHGAVGVSRRPRLSRYTTLPAAQIDHDAGRLDIRPRLRRRAARDEVTDASAMSCGGSLTIRLARERFRRAANARTHMADAIAPCFVTYPTTRRASTTTRQDSFTR